MKNGTRLSFSTFRQLLLQGTSRGWQTACPPQPTSALKRWGWLCLLALNLPLLCGCGVVTLLEGENGTIFGIETNVGTLFQIDPTTNKLEVLHPFTTAEGPPCVLVRGPKNTYYGAGFGKTSDILFRWEAGMYMVLHSLSNQEGRGVTALVWDDSRSLLYGTSASGGPYDEGTLFSYSLDGKFQVLHAFRHPPNKGISLTPIWLGTDHSLYGLEEVHENLRNGKVPSVTYVLFTYSPEGGYRRLHQFAPCYTFMSPLQASDGNVYFTAAGGWYGNGALLCFRPSQGVQLLYRLQKSGEGYLPELIAYRSGHLYGIAEGGVYGYGLLFNYFGGQYRVLHAFSSDSESPAISAGFTKSPASSAGFTRSLDSRSLDFPTALISGGVSMSTDGQLYVVSPKAIYVCTQEGRYTLARKLPPQLAPTENDGVVTYWLEGRLYGVLIKQPPELSPPPSTVMWTYNPQTQEVLTIGSIGSAKRI